MTESDAQDVVTDARIQAVMKRHPARVTYDRLLEHHDAYADQFTPRELTAMGVVLRALAAIERGER